MMDMSKRPQVLASLAGMFMLFNCIHNMKKKTLKSFLVLWVENGILLPQMF